MKKDLRISVTKRMLQEALLRLLDTKPLNKIKVNELCEESGVNRATFYRHYNSITDVLHDIEREFVSHVPKNKTPPQSKEEFRCNLEKNCTYFYEHRDLVKILLRNRSDEDMMRCLEKAYQNALDRQMEKNPSMPDDDTAKMILTVIGGGCQWLLRKWILDDIQKSPAEIAEILYSMILLPVFDNFMNL